MQLFFNEWSHAVDDTQASNVVIPCPIGLLCMIAKIFIWMISEGIPESRRVFLNKDSDDSLLVCKQLHAVDSEASNFPTARRSSHESIFSMKAIQSISYLHGSHYVRPGEYLFVGYSSYNNI